MTTGLYTILNSSINIRVNEVVEIGLNSIVLVIFYLYKDGNIIDFERVTIPNDSLIHWIKLE